MIDVEPLIVSELERMLPLPDGGRADWSDALRRAGLISARGRWRPVFVAAVVVAAFVGVGVAIAAGIGAFHGITAAQHPRTAADRLDPVVVASIVSHNRQLVRLTHSRRGLLEPDTSRLVRQLPNGARVYAVAATGDELCVVMERLPRLGPNMKRGGYTAGCTSPLTQKVPSTVESFRAFKGPHGESPALSWGITLDGATAVSFPANRHLTITVPVKHNVWVYLAKWSATVRGFTVHFKDGHTATIP
ncbi:MAG TPA: hypothetical protein VFH80_27845 [Solirubrobacteraceae bacterium]|nr:hypothetical protein [Solirubrobacteraceae bacterium]